MPEITNAFDLLGARKSDMQLIRELGVGEICRFPGKPANSLSSTKCKVEKEFPGRRFIVKTVENVPIVGRIEDEPQSEKEAHGEAS